MKLVTTALCFALLAKPALAFGDAGRGCYALITPSGGKLDDRAWNDIDSLTGLRVAVQFAPATGGTRNDIDVGIWRDHDFLLLGCVRRASMKKPPFCMASYMRGYSIGKNDEIFNWPADPAATMIFTVKWTADGQITVLADGSNPYTVKFDAAPTTLHLGGDDCQIEFTQSAQ